MYQVDYNNRYFRAHSITTDAYGIDPLRDKLMAAIAAITTFTPYVITQDENYAPDLISYNNYGKEDYWWHIMVYNGMFRYKEFVAGTTIKLPSLSELVQVTTDNTTIRNQSVTRVVTI